MTPPRFVPAAFCSALLGASSGLLLSACTEDVTAPEARINSSRANPSQGGLLVVVAPAETSAEEAEADETRYHVLVDGVELTEGVYGPILADPGGNTVNAGFHDPGVHHVELAATDAPTVFAVDGVITSGMLTRLYVFGPRGGLQARFDSYPLAPPAGDCHLSAINLVSAGGVQIEVVSCTDAVTCSPVSPPLSLGDTFDADVPSVSFSTVSPPFNNAGYGYQQVATASLPSPPVIPLTIAVSIPPPCVAEADGTDLCPTEPISGYIAAPIYMSTDGDMILEAD